MNEINHFHKLDIMIAEKIMGFAIKNTELPLYSTNISDAWMVVEKITELLSEPELAIQQDKSSGYKILWWVTFSGDRMSSLGRPKWTSSNTLPYAICIAALRSLGISDKELFD